MSVARTIIHIGSHKTGTSFLQAHFHFNSAALLADGIYYPQLERTPYVHQHSSLAIALRDADTGPALNALASLRERADEHRASTLFLSGEAFFFATPAEVALLRQALAADGGSEFRILVYLRNTYDYVRSQLNQHLRFGDYTVTESEFLSRLAIYRPDDIIRRWEAEFGPENVDVFSYDEHKRGLLAHFSDAARIPRLRACSVAPDVMNRSIDFLCALLMNQLLFHKDLSVKAAVYSALVAGHEAPGDSLYPREAAMIERILEQSRIELSHPKLLQIRSYLTSTPSPPSSVGQEKTSIGRMMAALRAILSVLEGGQASDLQVSD